MTKKYVRVVYEFEVEYEHPDHLDSFLSRLAEDPCKDVMGAGVASDGKVYGYSCERIAGVLEGIDIKPQL